MAVELNKLLQLVVDKKASDLHLTVGLPPSVRLHGNLRSLNLPPLTSDDTVSFMKAITPERGQQELKEKGGCDFGFSFEKKARFRVAWVGRSGSDRDGQIGVQCVEPGRYIWGVPLLRAMDNHDGAPQLLEEPLVTH